MYRLKNISIFLLLVLFCLSACTSQSTVANQEPAEQNEATAAEEIAEVEANQEQPVEVSEEASEAPAEHSMLTVMAAASLTEPFTEIGDLYEAENEGVDIVLNFAGSQQLAQQIAQGAPADVFASANQKQMDVVIEDGRIDKGSDQIFIRNKLVVIYPTDNPGDVKELADVARPGLKVVLADKEVPVGKYALEFLAKAVEDSGLGSDYQDNVLKNVVSYEANVKAVLSKVILGEADAGIVYTSDISGESIGQVGQIEIPDNLNVIATYPIAVINDSDNQEAAVDFINFVMSESGQQVLTKFGFIAPDTAAKEETDSGPISITDALGRTIEFETAPQRIVIAGKASTLIYSPIYLFPEAPSRVVTAATRGSQGIGEFAELIDANYKEKAALETDVGPEQIAALQPDVVLLKSYMAEKLGDPLEILGIPVIYLDFETPEQYWRDLTTLGQLFQNETAAERAIAFYQGRMQMIEEKLAGIADDEKPRQLLMYYNDKDGAAAFNVPPLVYIQTMLSEMAGGVPVWSDIELGNGWTKISLEQIASWDADQIYIIGYFNNIDEVVAGLKDDPQWQLMRAVKEGQLYGFAKDYVSWDQADSRWILGLEWLAAKTHPEIMGDIDMISEAQSFYQELYGVSQDDFETHIVPKFEGDIP